MELQAMLDDRGAIDLFQIGCYMARCARRPPPKPEAAMGGFDYGAYALARWERYLEDKWAELEATEW